MKNKKKLDVDNVKMDFDAISFTQAPSIMKVQYIQKKETGLDFTPYMKNVYGEAFKNQSFNQDGNESAVLGIKH